MLQIAIEIMLAGDALFLTVGFYNIKMGVEPVWAFFGCLFWPLGILLFANKVLG